MNTRRLRHRKTAQDPFWANGRIGRIMKALGRESFIPQPLPAGRS